MVYVDATCPLVSKVHIEAERHHRDGCHVLLIGHAGHTEVEGTMGQYRCVSDQGGIYLVETPEDHHEVAKCWTCYSGPSWKGPQPQGGGGKYAEVKASTQYFGY